MSKASKRLVRLLPASLNKQPPGSISLLSGCVLIQVLLQGGQALVVADLSNLPQGSALQEVMGQMERAIELKVRFDE